MRPGGPGPRCYTVAVKIWRPKSLNGLILFGLGLVALPLLVALVWALAQFDRFTRQYETLVLEGVTAMQHVGLMSERLRSLERQAKVYQVAGEYQDGEVDFMDLIFEDQQELEASLAVVSDIAARAGSAEYAGEIRETVRHLVDTLRSEARTGQPVVDAIRRLENRGATESALRESIRTYIDGQLNVLQDYARNAQETIAWQAIALLPVTLLLVITFALLVSRPIRRLDLAISQLGKGGFSKPIRVRGPGDLEALGRQLEWLRQRLLDLAQEKNRFLRHMSHELKTPLANIREGTDLLLEGAVGKLDAPQSEVTDIIRTNGLKLQRLIENLLSFSAWQTKSEILNLSEFSLRRLMVSVARDHRLAMAAKGIRLRLEARDFEVRADREKLRTVLDNLVSNAIKFTPQGGEIRLRAALRDKRFTLEVADSGPGIPAAERARVFDAFYQGSREQVGPVAGTGIGLSVVQECVQAHGGDVELVDGELSGAHFRIDIPQERVVVPQRMAANA